jgi:hypothetical protein
MIWFFGPCSDGYERAKRVAVLADAGPLVLVFDAARGLERQCLQAGSNQGRELEAQGLGPLDGFRRVRKIRWRQMVHNLGGRIAKHALRACIEYPYDARFIRGDAEKAGAVQDRVLQGVRLGQAPCAAVTDDDLHGDTIPPQAAGHRSVGRIVLVNAQKKGPDGVAVRARGRCPVDRNHPAPLRSSHRRRTCAVRGRT